DSRRRRAPPDRGPAERRAAGCGPARGDGGRGSRADGRQTRRTGSVYALEQGERRRQRQQRENLERPALLPLERLESCAGGTRADGLLQALALAPREPSVEQARDVLLRACAGDEIVERFRHRPPGAEGGRLERAGGD